MTIAFTLDSFLLLLLCATAIYILRWMLIGRLARTGVRSVLAIPPGPPRASASTHVPFANTSPLQQRANAAQSACSTRRAPITMLRNAVNDLQRKSGQTQISQSSFAPSSFGSQQQAAQPVSPAYKNPLKPSSASALNGVRDSRSPHRAGIKRTSSGLAKSLDGTFENDGGAKYQPIVIGGGQAAGKVSIPQAMFDENEFDDDIDLDVEEPLARTTNIVSYPDLSAHLPEKTAQRSSQTAAASLDSYPSLSTNAAKAGDGLMDFSSRSESHTMVEPEPTSSALPWSSSPLEHFQPTGRPQQSLQSFAFDGTVSKKSGAQQDGSPQPRPAKRRLLPWFEGLGPQKDSEPTQSIGGTKYKSRSSMATPAPSRHPDNKASFPWNTTASAIKEQQKKKREETRKMSSRVVDGTEESIRKATSKQKRPAKVFLSDEQQHVLELVIEKKRSVFFTGSAGTGKSVLMREIIASLRRQYQREPDRVAVTASTGLAACNVGGVTLHSFAGIGLGKEDVPELVRKIKKNQKAKHRWMRTKVLVLDEVSMVDGELFDKLESIARQIRNNGRPFGGIQLVITGDFFQLPPVPDSGRVAKFAFDASTWPTSIDHTIGLHHVFRQKDPGKYAPHAYRCGTLIYLQSSLVCSTKCVRVG